MPSSWLCSFRNPYSQEHAPPASTPHRRVWCLEETQHRRQGDLGPQCARPGREHPRILHKSSGGAARLRSPPNPPSAGPTPSGPTWVFRAQAPSPPGQCGQVPVRGSGGPVTPHLVRLALGVAFGFVFIFLSAEPRFRFIQTGCPLVPTKCRHFKAPITVYV